jgi:hypothetical protein
MIGSTLVYFHVGMAYQTKTLMNGKAQLWNLDRKIYHSDFVSLWFTLGSSLRANFDV